MERDNRRYGWDEYPEFDRSDRAERPERTERRSGSRSSRPPARRHQISNLALHFGM